MSLALSQHKSTESSGRDLSVCALNFLKKTFFSLHVDVHGPRHWMLFVSRILCPGSELPNKHIETYYTYNTQPIA